MTRYGDECIGCGVIENRPQVVPAEGERDEYGALTWAPEWVKTLVREAEAAGVFRTRISGDARRWVAVNTDVYGYDADEDLAVVQVRQTRSTKYGRETRKNYFLLGHVESGAVFAHPVVSPRKSVRAMSSPLATVRYCLTRVWRCDEDDLNDIVRQGDVALIPVSGLPEDAELLTETEMIVADSHRLKAASLYRREDDLFARGRMSMVHLGHEHTTVRIAGGTRRVSVGYREPTWDFSAPTVD